MQTQHFRYFFRPVLLPIVLLAMFTGRSAAASPQIIYSFAGDKDGAYLDTDLVIDNSGNLYGTSVQGGDFASGTVWELSPTSTGWVHKVLYSFRGGADGGEPYKGATLDAQGNLYGTAVTGGAGSCEGGCGVIWKLTRTGSTWTQSVIHTFTGGEDGSGPGSGLTLGENGTLFGMTPTGGINGQGVIFQLKLTTTGVWKFKVLHAFTGGDDGGGASAGRLLLYKGIFYGVTTTGGANGEGVVFRLARTAGVWQFSTLYAFKGAPDAGFPYGGLAVDNAGNLYGTTYYSGTNGFGSVYEVSPQPDGTWKETVVYSFQGGTDGSGSIANLVFTNAGAIYGTTSAGGASCDCGTIFKLTSGVAGPRLESVVYRFHGAPGGAFAYNGMVGDGAGNFYGTTVHGGPSDDGVIYRLTP
ncbi:MAG TPA: choice-of-anchor tandem repeat GloVer-containing protein [Terriglobales bacterium]|nr:choice-of-anchor tandem repeat GloVer-containing protein [Terriglobales bacterium]